MRQMRIDWATEPDRAVICLNGLAVLPEDLAVLKRLGWRVPVLGWVLPKDAPSGRVIEVTASLARLEALGLVDAEYGISSGETLFTPTRLGHQLLAELDRNGS